jgi:hypothetical protein
LKQLEAFAGKWRIEGKNFPVPPGNGETPVHGEDNYEWLNGKFYLIDNWKHMFDVNGHQGVSILGFDSGEKKLFTRNFDNIGFDRRYILENDNNKWKIIGDKERATPSIQQRW